MNQKRVTFRKSLNTSGTFLALALIFFFIMLFPSSAQSYTTYLRVGVSDYKTGATYQTIYNNNETNASAIHSFDTRYDQYNLPYSASASGSFDLASGEVKFFMEAIGYEAATDVAFSFMDKIFPYWLGDSGRTDPISITITWEVNGAYTKTGTSLQNLGLYAWFGYGVNTNTITYHSTNQYNLIDGTEYFSLSFNFTPGPGSYIKIGEAMGGWLDPYNGQTATANFSNTGTLEVLLSQGAAFTSESGVFLTDNSVAAPLPPGVWLLGSALLCLGGWRRFRKS